MLLLFFGCSLTFMWLFSWKFIDFSFRLSSVLPWIFLPFLSCNKNDEFHYCINEKFIKTILFAFLFQSLHYITLLLVRCEKKLIITRVLCYYFIKIVNFFLLCYGKIKIIPSLPFPLYAHSFFMNFVSLYFYLFLSPNYFN